MRRQKQFRRLAFSEMPRSFGHDAPPAGVWRETLGLAPDAPLVVELAAGRADFSVELARANPTAGFVAVDGKAERLWAGALRAQQEGVANVAFLHHDIGLLAQAFVPGEVSRLWITFPDPFPKLRHAPRRLTAPGYWPLYRRLLAPGGTVELKTDDAHLFAFTLDVLATLQLSPVEVSHDLGTQRTANAEAYVLTAYERRFQAEGRPTHYLRVRMNV